jgi:hypothetical protein
MSGTLKLNDTTFATENAGSISATVNNLDVVTSMTLPRLASDPANPVAGQIYYNTTDGVVKHWTGTEWLQMSNKFSATGGTETISNGYKYHTFTSSGTFTTKTSGGVEYLIVAGGGGSGTSNGAGGGGAGGLLNGTIYVNQQAYSIVIGAGGANSGGSRLVRAGNGNNSTALGLTAIGGGSAGTEGNPYSEALNRGNDGGSGGSSVRAGFGYPTGSGTPGQGNNAGANVNDGSPYYAGGGGGGAGAPGTNGSASYLGNGGNGLQFLEWATATSTGVDNGYYAGGGAAGAYYSTSPGVGGTPGLGGGGQGGSDKNQSQLNGVINTGGGGGGHGNAGVASGSGGSGIVIIRYPI